MTQLKACLPWFYKIKNRIRKEKVLFESCARMDSTLPVQNSTVYTLHFGREIMIVIHSSTLSASENWWKLWEGLRSETPTMKCFVWHEQLHSLQVWIILSLYERPDYMIHSTQYCIKAESPPVLLSFQFMQNWSAVSSLPQSYLPPPLSPNLPLPHPSPSSLSILPLRFITK